MATGNDTYVGALEVLAKQISTMMGLADANLPFCVQLLQAVTEERRSPDLALRNAGISPGGAPAPGGIPMGAGVPAPPPAFLGDASGGMAPPPPSNPDELRRVLQHGVA